MYLRITKPHDGMPGFSSVCNDMGECILSKEISTPEFYSTIGWFYNQSSFSVSEETKDTIFSISENSTSNVQTVAKKEEVERRAINTQLLNLSIQINQMILNFERQNGVKIKESCQAADFSPELYPYEPRIQLFSVYP